MSYLIPGWPYKSQLNPAFANSADACGFTCDAMCIDYATGINLTPEQDMDQTPQAGPGYVGFDYSVWMVQDLQNHGVGVSPSYGQDGASALGEALANLRSGRPSIVLSAENIGNHYTVLVGENPDGTLVRANPATGGPEKISQSDWINRFVGDLLMIQSPLWSGARFAKYRVTTDQHLRAQPAASSAQSYEMLVNWECIALGPVTPNWILVVDLSGKYVGWMLRSNVAFEASAALPSGFVGTCGSAQVTTS